MYIYIYILFKIQHMYIHIYIYIYKYLHVQKKTKLMVANNHPEQIHDCSPLLLGLKLKSGIHIFFNTFTIPAWISHMFYGTDIYICIQYIYIYICIQYIHVHMNNLFSIWFNFERIYKYRHLHSWPKIEHSPIWIKGTLQKLFVLKNNLFLEWSYLVRCFFLPVNWV